MAEDKMRRATITSEKLEGIKGRVDWKRVRAMTEEEIERDLASDPDAAPPMSDVEVTAARVRWVRKTTGLTQEGFAARYRIPLGTLRDWEQARTEPDTAALAYLRVIEKEPEAVARALEEPAAA
jgi:putative transcriptional regulator